MTAGSPRSANSSPSLTPASHSRRGRSGVGATRKSEQPAPVSVTSTGKVPSGAGIGEGEEGEAATVPKWRQLAEDLVDRASQYMSVPSLRQAIEALQEVLCRMDEVEERKKKVILQIRELKTETRLSIEEMERKIEFTEAQRIKKQGQLDNFDRLRLCVVNLYLEFQERSAPEGPSHMPSSQTVSRSSSSVSTGSGGKRRGGASGGAHSLKALQADQDPVEEERSLLMKESPFVIMERLNHQLRFLLNFKEEYEAELEGRLARRRAASEREAELLNQRIRQLKEEFSEMKLTTSEAQSELQAEEKLRDEVYRENDTIVAELQRDNAWLKEQVHTREEQRQDLQQRLDERDELVRKKEMRLMKITQLQNDLEKHRKMHNHERDLVGLENQVIRSDVQKKQYYVTHLEAEVGTLREELDMITKKLNAYRLDVNRAALEELEIRRDAAHEAVREQDAELERLERKFRLLEQEDKDIQSKLAAMEEEYALIHEAYMQEKRHQRQEEELEHKRRLKAAVHETVLLNTQARSDYEEQLKTKERTAEELKTKLKMLLRRDKASSRRDRHMEEERLMLDRSLGSRGGL